MLHGRDSSTTGNACGSPVQHVNGEGAARPALSSVSLVGHHRLPDEDSALRLRLDAPEAGARQPLGHHGQPRTCRLRGRRIDLHAQFGHAYRVVDVLQPKGEQLAHLSDEAGHDGRGRRAGVVE